MKAATTISVNESGTASSDVISPISSDQVQTNQTTDYGLATNVKDGVILHAWCWSFNTIKDNLKDIAEAGYTTVQTSPANECNDSNTTMKIMGSDTAHGTDGCWWWHYQPTDWKIGNYQVGTRDDFKALCAEAAKYGVKIIVDVLPNHTAPDKTRVSQDLIDASGGWDKLFHANGFNEIKNYNDRFQCTTGQMGGLWDVNTENPAFQAYYLNYCNDLIDCGASGFRYDTAKHIGLPSDPVDAETKQNGWTNNFWSVATGKQSANGVSLKNSDNLFMYGEVLQDSNDKAGEYGNYMDMCASIYGGTLRGAISNKNFSTGNISGYQHVLTPSKLVTWVESHDTYCNKGESVGLTDWQIRMAWSVIAARKESTPLFFSRPDGSNGWSNRWGNNVLGAKGNDEFKAPEVAAVNKFRNAMVGENEYLRNINGNSQILSIERGTKGQVIINLGADIQINSDTKLADGTYTDQVSGGTFIVSGGKISGTLKAGKVTVLYDAKPVSGVTSSVATSSFDANSLSVKLSAKNVTNAKYSIDGAAQTSYTDGTSLTLGTSLVNGSSTTLTLLATATDGSTISSTYTYTKKQATYQSGYLYAKPSGWGSTVYAYIYDESTGTAKTVAPWPGVKMTYDTESSRYYYQLPAAFQTAKTQVIFTDGTNQMPAAKQAGAYYTVGKALSFDGTSITAKDSTQVVTVLQGGEISTDKVSPQNVNTAIKITTADATGGTGSYTYKFDVNGIALQDYSTATSTTWTPTSAGTYTITVTTKDSAGTTVTKTITYVINDTIAKNLTTIYYKGYVAPYIHYRLGTGSWTIAPGVAMTATTEMEGYTHKITIDLGTATILTTCFNNGSGGWDSSNGANYTFNAGTYVYASGKITKIADPVKTFGIDSFAANVDTPQLVGTPITLTTTSSNGTGTVQTKFTVNDGTTTTILKDYSTDTNVVWTQVKSGTYTLTTSVKDTTGTEVTKSIIYVIKDIVIEPTTINSFTTSVATPQLVGTAITLNTTSSGGTGTLQTKFTVNDGTTTTTLKDYSTDTTAIWTPIKSGTYTLTTSVKDTTGTEVTKTISYVISDTIVKNQTTIYYKGYATPYIHYRVGTGSWTTVPGIAMTATTEMAGYTHKITIDLGTATTLTACFNNGSGTWDSKNGANYNFNIGKYTYSNGSIVLIN